MKIRSFTLLGKLHIWLSHSGLVTSIALKIRNQCQAIIRNRLNDGIDPDKNGEYLILSLVAPDARTFIDVGANVGNWAKRFSELMSRPGFGLLFEPSPIAQVELNKMVANIKTETVIIGAAVGNKIGESTFYAESYSGETSSLIPGFSNSNSHKIIVRMTTIDHEVSSRGIEFIDYLKIDAEGYDLKVLMGAKETLAAGKIGIVQFEYNSPWAQTCSTLTEAIRILNEYGYKVFLLKKNGLYKINNEIYGEYYGYSNYIGVSENYYENISHLYCGGI